MTPRSKPQQGHFRLQLPLGCTLPQPHFLFAATQPGMGPLVGFTPQNRVRHSISSLQSLAPLWMVKPVRATESRTERYTRGSQTTKGTDGRARMERWISKNKDNMGEPPQWGLHTLCYLTPHKLACFKWAFTKMSFHLPFLSAVKETSQCRAFEFVVSI